MSLALLSRAALVRDECKADEHQSGVTVDT